MSIFKKKEIMVPKHVGILIDKVISAKNIEELIYCATQLKIPVLTIGLPQESGDVLGGLIQAIGNWQYIVEHQIKISVLGKWYALSEQIVQQIKVVVEKTKEYDGFFLNLCVNYDGQAEIVSACKLLAKQVQSGKLDPDAIDELLVKENVFTSNFMPPEVIIITGAEHCLHNFLLWDSGKSKIVFTGKPAEKLSVKEFERFVTNI
ncbi:MAG: undecaprenyl diphosphate synthase family protein [Candidatus Woesearchaeota archaeon]|nr:undecaprenyl diphosphate synthase family protein [Candidatus Woesearchaeota archaeon]